MIPVYEFMDTLGISSQDAHSDPKEGRRTTCPTHYTSKNAFSLKALINLEIKWYVELVTLFSSVFVTLL